MNVLLIILCIFALILGVTIYNFKRRKKKYLPLNDIHLTEGQKTYILRHLETDGYMDYSDTSYIVNKIKFNELDEHLLRKLNEYMNNLTLNIGFIKIK